MGRRAFTVVELLIAVSLTAIIAGTLVSVYVFVSTRAAHAVAEQNVLDQVRDLASDIARTVENSVRCEVVTVSGQSALKCLLPAQPNSTDARNVATSFAPTALSARGIERWGEGQRVWFYQSDDTGKLGRSGDYVWRAVRNDDSVPTDADADRAWSYYYSTSRYRWSLINEVSFSVSSSDRSATVKIKGSVLATEAERRGRLTGGDTLEKARTYWVTMTRTAYWLRWRR
jgi:type II secretory pathway pseudopilin PulG